MSKSVIGGRKRAHKHRRKKKLLGRHPYDMKGTPGGLPIYPKVVRKKKRKTYSRYSRYSSRKRNYSGQDSGSGFFRSGYGSGMESRVSPGFSTFSGEQGYRDFSSDRVNLSGAFDLD